VLGGTRSGREERARNDEDMLVKGIEGEGARGADSEAGQHLGNQRKRARKAAEEEFQVG
jgi:hypothetical protein